MKHRITCPLCEALCALKVTTDAGRVTEIRGNPNSPLSRGHICPKGVALQDLHTDPDRLRHPVRKKNGEWVRVGWEEAIEEVAERLADTQARWGKDAVGLYYGNPVAHNYGALLALQSFKKALGSRNVTSATSSDQLPHMYASLLMFGHQLLLPVPDIDRADLFIVLGGNPAVSGGSLMTAPGAGKRLKAIQKRGGEVIVIDPRRTETADLADAHHFVQPGTDPLLMLAMLHTVFEEKLTAPGPWRGWSRGLPKVEAAARRFSPEAVAETTGIAADTIRSLARKLAKTPRAALYARFGVCTQPFGGLSGWLAVVLNAVTGHLDSVGGLMFPKPAVDVRALGTVLGQKGSADTWRTRVSDLPSFADELPASAMAEEMETSGTGQIKAMITMAGNPVRSIPNGPRLDRAMAKLDFVVSLDFYINETTRHADLILPPPSPMEHDHYGIVFHALAVRNTARYSPALFHPPEGDVRPEWSVLLDLGQRLLKRRGGIADRAMAAGFKAIAAAGPERWLDSLLRAGPYGQLRGKHWTLARLKNRPDGVDLGPLIPMLPGALETDTGKVDLAPDPLVADLDRLETAWTSGALVPQGDDLSLIGRRQLRSLNSWMHNSARLMKGKDRCTLLLHPRDAEARSIKKGDTVQITSRTGTIEATAQPNEAMMPGVVSLPHGWGHNVEGVSLGVAAQSPGPSLNDITDESHVDRLTGTSGFSGVPVTVTLAKG